jgi:hypothetical protein
MCCVDRTGNPWHYCHLHDFLAVSPLFHFISCELYCFKARQSLPVPSTRRKVIKDISPGRTSPSNLSNFACFCAGFIPWQTAAGSPVGQRHRLRHPRLLRCKAFLPPDNSTISCRCYECGHHYSTSPDLPWLQHGDNMTAPADTNTEV